MSAPTWTFQKCVPADRQQQLFSWYSFDNVIGAIISAPGVEVEAIVWRPAASAHLRGSNRAEFLLRVPPETYDGFFNSPVGYRAQYALSPLNGLEKNRTLLVSMESMLMSAAERSGLDEASVKTSIAGAQAKVWIDEDEVKTHFFGLEPEIRFDRWNSHPDGESGSRAPVGTRLVICGGWVDKQGLQVINPYKAQRAEEIYSRGYS
jgi:hypothetical protein